MTTNICTIATDDWVDVHLARWARYVRANVPDAKMYVYLASDRVDQLKADHPVLSQFAGVKRVARSVGVRPWFNSVRMGACADFTVDEILYVDCDADVLADVSDVGQASDKPLLWLASPILNSDWLELCPNLGYGVPDVMADNCFLWMRKDWSAEYAAAVDAVRGSGVPVSPRTAGTMAFNVMLARCTGEHARLDDALSCIWWESHKWATARVVQYCNDAGKAKRERLESGWRAVPR